MPNPEKKCRFDSFEKARVITDWRHDVTQRSPTHGEPIASSWCPRMVWRSGYGPLTVRLDVMAFFFRDRRNKNSAGNRSA
jgi:hypothetical protein